MKSYLECLKEAAEILERPYTYAYIKQISTEETEKLFNKAADIYASQSSAVWQSGSDGVWCKWIREKRCECEANGECTLL